MSLLELLDRPIAFQRCFVTLTGSINAALMLSQGVYWSNRTEDPEGWFYKSRDEWLDETGLSHEQQETCRKRLRGLGLWDEKEDRLAHRVYFRILDGPLRDKLKEMPVSPNRKTRFRETVKDGSAAPLFPVPSNRAETTSETTSENKALPREVAEEFRTVWNDTLPNDFPRIQTISSGRARALRARLKEPGWEANWRAALDRMSRSPFCKGQNSRKWRADVDFFLRPDSVAKILEGKYDGESAPVPAEVPFWRAHV